MEIMKIPLAKITPAFEIQRCKSVINNIKRCMNYKSVLYIPLFVEKQSNDKYLLIGNYQDYYAVKETYNDPEKNILLPCVIINTSITRKERLLIIIRYLLRYSTLGPLDKHTLFVQLRKHITAETLAKETGLTTQEVSDYLFHPNIPDRFRKLFYLDRLLILNKIENLDLALDLKEKLYYLAVLPEEDSKRLTYEKLMCFSRFIRNFKKQLGRISKTDKETLLIKIIESDLYIEQYLEHLLYEYAHHYKRTTTRILVKKEINTFPFPTKRQQHLIKIRLKNKVLFTY
ncbi:hypothetical protein [Alkalihalobacterium chitinilyticum]|uniref:ParB/Sulfiredoxin domain-containing protein n=1 Tax=Alkalihalobacterium chitinilyticum TaxID=2980103 RepID=A0ABT5VG97_9BACI|nr:hypothetical protein [Alkalihalobacterium chitinilyticum]MDE5414484.1 hypothetical protein [Alkalihalobacterium chitinilyticum]